MLYSPSILFKISIISCFIGEKEREEIVVEEGHVEAELVQSGDVAIMETV